LQAKHSLNHFAMSRARSDTDVFHAIADGTRRRLLEALTEGEQPVGSLAERFDVSLPAISQQLKVLREVGLVGVREAGRQRICFLQPEGLQEVAEWVGRYEEFWRARLLALDRHVRKRKED
jgi:DNA-binding transcriptional ArsR family regulator